MLERRHSSEAGFTMVEMVIASGIVLTVISVFTIFMASVSGVQRSMDLDSIASRVLNDQVEAVNGMGWDNMMMAETEGSNTPCDLGSGRLSTRNVMPGPDKYTVDNVSVAITREIIWAESVDAQNQPVPVECTAGNMDRAEPKKVIITAQWKDGSYTKSKSVTLLKSKWIDFTDQASINQVQSGLEAVYTAPVLSANGWCAAYTDANGPGTTGSASMVNGTLTIALNAEGSSICGYNVTGLTAGTTYTALLEVKVPQGATPIEAVALNSGRGSLAIADGKWHQISYTWTETGTSRLVGVAPQVGANRAPGSTVSIRSLQVFAQR